MNHILARFQDAQALISPERSAWLESCAAAGAAAIENLERRLEASGERMDNDGFWFAPDDWRSAYRPYVVKDGILQIPVKGALLHNFSYTISDWITGYEYIWRAFERGMGDPEVRGIALIVDSGGGMVAGCFELVDKMYAMRGTKPIRGFASEHAYSAAYAVISAADYVTVARTGGVGSIGVVTSHMDASGMMTQFGLKRTWVHKGAHKVDGNSDGPLPDDVKARWLADLEIPYSIFVSTVARNRGLDEQAIRETEALTYRAPDALSTGLVDAIGDFSDALADFSASLNPQQGDGPMADFTQADIDNAVATATANHAAELAAARAEGVTAERTRISAIMNSDAAANRPTAALACAMDTDLSVEAAAAFLGKMPEEPKAAAPAAEQTGAGAPQGMFKAAMDGSPNPDLTDAGGQELSAEDLALAQSRPHAPRKAA